MKFPLSILDLVPIRSGSTSAAALQESVELARLAEKLGYTRYWVAEHHSMPSIASSAPEVVIAHLAAATKTIRVGAGGIMLPNHTPLRVAEVFHTLEALHPDRIDLGIGRAPGTDPATSSALRPFDPDRFPAMLSELRSLSAGDFPPGHPFHTVQAVPDDVDLPPIWLLGSSGASAAYAGAQGLGYSFASHFSPTSPLPAIQAYRQSFKPSNMFKEPHVILAISVVCAETEDHADYLGKTMDLSWVRLRRGERGRLPSPKEAEEYPYTPEEQALVRARRDLMITGNPTQVRDRIEELIQETEANEIMISSMIYDAADRYRSYELIAEAFA